MDTSNSNVKESALKANAKYSAYVCIKQFQTRTKAKYNNAHDLVTL